MPPAPSGPAGPVAYVMSRFPKLTETFVLGEIRAMEAAGVRVQVYPLLRERQRVRQPEADAWARRARFHPFLSGPVVRASLHFIRRRPRAYLGVLAEVLRGTWGSPNFFAGAVAIFPKAVRFAYEMQRSGVVHVHAHFATHPAVAALVVHRLTGIPFSFTAHGSDLHVDRRMLAAKVRAAAFAVAVSRFNREVMVRECGEWARERVHVVHCGVDLDLFAPRPPAPRGGPLRVVCVASLEEVKGHRFLLEACRVLRERGVDFRCDLAGDGPLRRAVEEQVERAGLWGRVRLHGGLPRPEVLRLLREADVAALASRPTRQGKREGIPVALMEAMACGLPVVSTAISGIPELVEHGRTGLLVQPGDARALADTLEALAADPALRARMGREGRAKVSREFELHGSARRLLELFGGKHSITPTREDRMASRELVSTLWCPTCREGALRPAEGGREPLVDGELVCEECGRDYPVRFGVPALLPHGALAGEGWRVWEEHLEKLQARREDRIRNPHRAVTRWEGGSRVQAEFARFTGIASGRVLDVGCGPGKFRLNFDPARVEYVGLDPIALPEVDRFPFVRGLAEYLPFRAGAFTDVVVLAALDHFREPERFFAEAARVLAPGGRLHVVQSVHEARGPVSAVRVLGHLVKDAVDDWHSRGSGSGAPKHLAEFTRRTLLQRIEPYFGVVGEESYAARWYSPVKLFLTLAPVPGRGARAEAALAAGAAT